LEEKLEEANLRAEEQLKERLRKLEDQNREVTLRKQGNANEWYTSVKINGERTCL
jgi:hypothetical protein